jgi:hypothetical protein
MADELVAGGRWLVALLMAAGGWRRRLTGARTRGFKFKGLQVQGA